MIRKETLRVLEYRGVLQRTAAFAHSPVTMEEILLLSPLESMEEIVSRSAAVEEVRTLARLGVPLRLGPFEDIRPLLDVVRPEGGVAEPRDLLVLVPVLRLLSDLARQTGYRSDIPRLKEEAASVSGFPDLLDEFEVSLDGEGNILDSASPLLYDIRGRKRSLTARIRKRLEEIVRERQVAIFLQDDFITQRGGRWVIPVRMDSKGMVAGVVHDVSNSGETAFMEPLEIIPLVNELENLAADEKGEMIRIVREICRMIRAEADSLEEQFRALVRVDMLSSIASFADLTGGEVPQVTPERRIRIAGGRHPILLLLARERGGEVVPLDFTLGEEETVMGITGPNAGGKTISLKTTGLLLLMALTGFPVPASSASVFPLVSDLLVDIGDDQSIETSLSTFSAHVSNIAGILQKGDERALVLLDELGTGTEPVQGGALSCAILRELQAKGAAVVATTHLTEIAAFVHRSAGMVNASMEYDRQTLAPLYRLKKGEPGQSHALDIARRYGIPDHVTDFARGMLGRMETEFHDLLAELKETRRRYEEELSRAEELRRDAEEKERRLQREAAESAVRTRETLERAYRDARDVVAAARREVNAIIEEARRERSRISREKLAETERRIEEKMKALRPEEHLSPEQVTEGMTVHVASLGYDAVVLSVDRRHGRARVKAGNLEIEVPLAGIAPRAGKKVQPPPPRRGKPAEAPAEPQSVLNLVGFRVDEALPRLETFLNDAVLSALAEVRVVHGVGTGTLLRGVREYLQSHPLVRELRRGESFEGGEGVTVVRLA